MIDSFITWFSQPWPQIVFWTGAVLLLLVAPLRRVVYGTMLDATEWLGARIGRGLYVMTPTAILRGLSYVGWYCIVGVRFVALVVWPPPRDADPAPPPTQPLPPPDGPLPAPLPADPSLAFVPLSAPVPCEPVGTSDAEALLRPLVSLADMGPQPTPMAIPIGITAGGVPLWSDLMDDGLHFALYGQTKAGKDSWLRACLQTLASANPPSAVQFAILDGKLDWLLRSLRELDHMFFAPVGGYGTDGNRKIMVGAHAISAEMARRAQCIADADVRNRDQFVAKTGESMPILVVIITDGGSIDDRIEGMLGELCSKARSLGTRVIVSMQTPIGKRTDWRTNVSTVLCGALLGASQDTPALSLSVADMVYRPSLLTSANLRQGGFVVRRGNGQYLVQAPFVPEQAFDAFVRTLPKADPPRVLDDDDDDLTPDEQQILAIVRDDPDVTQETLVLALGWTVSGRNKVRAGQLKQQVLAKCGTPARGQSRDGSAFQAPIPLRSPSRISQQDAM